MANSFDKVGGRKFLLVCAIFIVLSVGLFTAKLTGSEYITGVSLIFSGYIAINVTQKKVQGNGTPTS